MNQAQAVVSVAAELRLFLRPGRRSAPVAVALDGTSSLGHVVESLGVPLTEAGRLLVNGEPTAPGYRPRNADVVMVEAVRRPQLAPARFVLDVHLGTVARRLRLAGVDAAYVKLSPVAKAAVAPVLPPGTRRTYQTFSSCRNCGQVYWHGAHSKRLEQIIDSAVRAVSTGANG